MSVLQEILADLKAAILGAGEEPRPEEAEQGAPGRASHVSVPGPAVEEQITAVAATEPDRSPPAPPTPPGPIPAGRAGGKGWRSPWALAVGGAVALVAVVAGVLLLARSGFLVRAPGKEVVAVYVHPWQDTEKTIQVTKEDLRAYLAARPEAAPTAADGYHLALEQMVVDQLLWDGLLGRMGSDSVRAVVADVMYGRYPVSALGDVAATIPVDDSDVREYYENHADQFTGRTLSEARDEILGILRQQQEATYLESHVADLRSRASVVVHSEVLAIPEPDETAISAYYQEHLDDLTPPRQVAVAMLRFHQTEAARAAAELARSELGQGQDLATVGEMHVLHSVALQNAIITEGTHTDEFDRVIFGLAVGEISPVVDGGDAYYIVVPKQPSQGAILDDDRVKDEISTLLWAQSAADWFETRADSSLFEVSGWAYKAGDFYNAFKSQPPEVSAVYSSTQGLDHLVERTIDWLLVVENARRQGYPPEGQGSVYDRVDLLERVTGTEIQSDLTVGDDQVLEYYNEHPKEFLMPTRFQVRWLALDLGATTADKSTLQARAQEAYDRLRQLGRPPTETEFLEEARSLGKEPDMGASPTWIVAARLQDIEVIDTGENLIAHPLYDSLQDLQAGDLALLTVGDTLYLVQVLEREDEHQLDLYVSTTFVNDKFGPENARLAVEELSGLLLEQAGLTIFKSNLRAMSVE